MAKGWSNPIGDAYFEKRRKIATNPNKKEKVAFYGMTRKIGAELVSVAGILNLNPICTRVLDLCMAPGGFSATVRQHLPGSPIDAITLPPEAGGYGVIDTRLFEEIIYADITMYAKEMDFNDEYPAGHPDSKIFDTSRPFLETQYDVVFCGGAVGRNHPRKEYRDHCESSRLTISQLVFAMNRPKPGGSLVLLLHRVESWDTVCILHAFNQFSDIQLFKHSKFHGIKSSFYMVAKNINLEHDAAKLSHSYWKSLWRYLTFKEFENTPLPSSGLYGSESAFVRQMRDEFGPQFLEFARPIWTIQADSLRKRTFTRSG